ncbi:MAG: universal stress protein [Cyclobacteriaceae bacterium]
MFNRILVPTDFTPKSSNALKVAVDIAKKTDSIIDLLHIVETPLILKEQHGEKVLSNLASDLIEISNRKLDYIKSSYSDQDVIIKTRTKVDELPDKVAELITADDYDLIVIGGNIVYQFYEFVGKSNPERVVELARCPVLVLNSMVDKFKINKLVLPSSLDNSIVKVIDQIREIKAFFQAEIEVLFVNTPNNFKSTEEIKIAWKKFKGLHDIHDMSLTIHNDYSIKKGIINHSKQNDVDLILLTSKHSSKPLSVLSGDITEYLVNHEDQPVLTFNLKNNV